MKLPTKRTTKKVLRLIGARRDIEYAIQASGILHQTADEDIFHHVFVSFVLSYGRPFTDNRGIGSLLCDYPDYKEHPDEEIRIKHSRLLDLRNEFVAHSSIQSMKLIIVPPNVTSPISSRILGFTTFAIGKRIFPKIDFVDWLFPAIEALRQRLDSDTDTFLNEEFSHFTSSIPIETGADEFKWKIQS